MARIKGMIVAISAMLGFLIWNPYFMSVAQDENSPEQEQLVEAKVIIVPKGDSILLHYTLSAPIEALSFNYSYGPVREKYWSVVDDGSTLEDGVYKRTDGGDFQSLTLELHPDEQGFDRVYPATIEMTGKGLILNSLYLRLNPAVFATTYVFQPSEGSIAIHEQVITTPLELSNEELETAYILLGDAPQTVSEQFILGYGTNVPAWITEEIESQLATNLSYLATQFKIEMDGTPTLFVTYNPEGKGYRWHGDVNGKNTISMRLTGPDWQTPSDELRSNIRTFLVHELVHFWNRMSGNQENRTIVWLKEGGADYLAHRALFNQGALSAEKMEILLNRNFNQCQRALRNNPLSKLGGGGSIPYNCGFFINWLWDQALSRKTDQSIFDVWAAELGSSRKEGINYSLEGFLNTISHLGLDVVVSQTEQIQSSEGIERWEHLSKYLREQNVNLAIGNVDWASQWQLVGMTLMPLMRSDCTERPIGFHGRDSYYELDTEDRCSALNSNPKVDSINDVSLVSNTQLAYEEVYNACSMGAKVRVGIYNSDESIELRCDAQMVTPYKILKAFDNMH